jgi:hypothetical protein
VTKEVAWGNPCKSSKKITEGSSCECIGEPIDLHGFLVLASGNRSKVHFDEDAKHAEKLQKGRLSGKEYRGHRSHGKPKAKQRYHEVDTNHSSVHARERAWQLHKSLNPKTKHTDWKEFFVKCVDTPIGKGVKISPKTTSGNKTTQRSRRRNPKDRKRGGMQCPLSLRRFLVDSGASFHLVCFKTLTPREKGGVRKMKKPIPIYTANGVIYISEEVEIHVVELGMTVTAHLLANSPCLLSLGLLCKENEYNYHWDAGDDSLPFLQKHGGPRIFC